MCRAARLRKKTGSPEPLPPIVGWRVHKSERHVMSQRSRVLSPFLPRSPRFGGRWLFLFCSHSVAMAAVEFQPLTLKHRHAVFSIPRGTIETEAGSHNRGALSAKNTERTPRDSCHVQLENSGATGCTIWRGPPELAVCWTVLTAVEKHRVFVWPANVLFLYVLHRKCQKACIWCAKWCSVIYVRWLKRNVQC